jgi:GTP-binding protein EngB required for normal cell division
MAGEQAKPEGWKEFYAGVVRTLKPGVTELIVHLSYDDAESQAVMVDHPAFGSAWRQRDFDVITSPEFKRLLEDNHVTLIGWKDLKKLL